MKKYFAALSATALISIAPYALAASSTDLTVTGAITPAACVPLLSNNGEIDIGKVKAKDLNLTTFTRVGLSDMTLNVGCDAPALFALNAIDNRAGTEALATWFGLGQTAAGENLGTINVEVISTMADAVLARMIQSRDNGATWAATDRFIRHTNLVSASSTADTSTPIPVQDLAMTLKIYTNIAPANTLTLSNEVNIDGSVTFEMKYL